MSEQEQKVLVIEDDPINQVIIRNILQEIDIQAIPAMDGQQGLQLAKSHCPDLILLDVLLPGLDGFQVIEKLKEHQTCKQIPVIFISALGEMQSQVNAFKHGAVDYITKPFNKEELLARIQTHLEIRRSRKQLEEQTQQLETAIDTINKQRLELEKTLGNLNQSIDYAQLIQSAFLPQHRVLQNNFSNHFLFFKPLDHLSGDFYWLKDIGNKILFGVGDCTGHGVPGALLSIISISMLNEITSQHIEYSPDYILNFLRARIKSTFRQSQNMSEVKDGLCMSLCVLEKETRILQYAGAYQPLYYFSAEEGKAKQLKSIKADKMPVSAFPNEAPFQLHEVQLQPKDILYLFTDGITDQFGGPKRKKLSKRKLYELIHSLEGKSFAQHADRIPSYWKNWKGEQLQTDDALLLGLEIF